MPPGSTAAGFQCAQAPECSGPGFRGWLPIRGFCQLDDSPGPASPGGDLAHGSGFGGTCRYRPNPTTSCAMTRSHGCARNWGSGPLPARKHLRKQTSRPGCLPAPGAPGPP
eukprot:9825407-Alexandrium_andersonii.AAC.1